MPGDIGEQSAQLDLWGNPAPQAGPAQDLRDRDRLPSGHHPDEPFDQVGVVWDTDLPQRVARAAKKILPKDRDRRRCVEELEATAANRGLTYKQVLDAYADCVSGLARPTETGPEDNGQEQRESHEGLAAPEVLIERMRLTLDTLERHFPVDCRLEHRLGDNVQITGPGDVAGYLRPTIAHLPQEQLRVLWLDTRNQVIGQHMAHQGTGNSAPVRAADVFRPAMAAGATGIIIAHNHPSGDPTPSREDIEITKRLRSTGKELGIELLDHVVVGRTASGREYASIVDILPSEPRGTPYHETAHASTPFGPPAPQGAKDPAGDYGARRPDRAAAPQALEKPLKTPDVSRGSVKPLCAAAEAKKVQAARTGKQARPQPASTPGHKRVSPAPRVTPAEKKDRTGHPLANHPLARLGRRKHGVR